MTAEGAQRIHKLIARTGFVSRRRAEELVAAGRVTVDGRPAAIGQRVDPASAAIEIDGVPLPVRPELAYYLLYKPEGVISTADDPQGRPTVVGLVPAQPRVYPVGRLDADTEGLLILTNDGDLTQRVTHPSFGVEKTYVALVDGVPSGETLRRLEDGIELDDGPARARRVRLLDRRPGRALVELVMVEGRNREVRRLLEAVGHPVVRLVRTSIDGVSDRDLRPGTWRTLTVMEVRELYAAAGDAP